MNFKTLMTLSMVGLLASPLALAEDHKQNIIGFGVTAQTSVANDEATAIMTKTVSAKTAKELASKINPLINQAIVIAKKYPSVTVSTGHQHAHPEYSKGKIVGVSGSASIHLKSQNTEELSNLMAELQSILLLENLSFDVSDGLRERTQAKLRDEAVHKFQVEAQSLVKAWGAKNYRLINAQMNSHSSGYAKVSVSPMMAMDAVAESAPSQNFEAGNSEINYQINGTIQLIY